MPVLLIDRRREQERFDHKEHRDHEEENHQEKFSALICHFFMVATPWWAWCSLWLNLSCAEAVNILVGIYEPG
jgi:hypothetical protein